MFSLKLVILENVYEVGKGTLILALKYPKQAPNFQYVISSKLYKQRNYLGFLIVNDKISWYTSEKVTERNITTIHRDYEIVPEVLKFKDIENW